jgi:hypothetical protein
VTWIGGTGYVVSPLDGVNGARRNLLARIGLSGGGRRVSGARGRSERNYARSGQTAGGTPLLESFDVRVREQQCAMRNVGFARLIEHEAQDVLDLRRATAFDVTQHRRRVS